MSHYVEEGYMVSGYANEGTYVDWPNKLIFVPKEETQLLQSSPVEIRSFNLTSFHELLRGKEDSPAGMPWERTHNYVGPVTVGGVQLAPVVEVINDYTITFEDGQYAVNLVGTNSNVGDRVNVNQVSVRSANSAGLTFSDEINSQSYTMGAIWVDAVEGVAGSAFPQGTPKSPVNNWADAMLIRDREKLDMIHIHGTFVLGPDEDIEHLNIMGMNPIMDILVLGGGHTHHANIEAMTVTGSSHGRIFFAKNCILGNIDEFSGGVVDSLIAGVLTVDPEFTDTITIANAGSALSTPAVVDMSTSTSPISCRNFSGTFYLKNFSQGSTATFDFLAGELFIDATSTSGTLVVRGNAKVTNLSTGETVKSGTINGGLVVTNEATSYSSNNALTVPKFLALK